MIQKFRPYLSSQELEEIIRCLKVAPTIYPSLLRSMELLTLKVQKGLLSPALTIQPSPAAKLESSLGFSVPSSSPPTPEELFQTWSLSPSSVTPAELSKVQQYRWEQSMMSPEEEAAYLSSLGMPSTTPSNPGN
jgi:hypothetical protein